MVSKQIIFNIQRCYQIIFLLGAAYHRAKGTMEMLKRLRVPVTMLGPYSYDAAPCELFFAAFKRADVNPNNIKLGKTHFKEVV